MTMTLPAELLYSLPFDCPFEFAPVPTYPVAPVVAPELTLRGAYLDALYNKTVSQQPLSFPRKLPPSLPLNGADARLSTPAQLSIDWFARLVLSRVPGPTPDASRTALRALLLPLHQFDAKWRSVTPGRLGPDSADGLGARALTKLGEEERARLVGAHGEWARAEQLRKADRQHHQRAAQAEIDRASLLGFGDQGEGDDHGQIGGGRAGERSGEEPSAAKGTSWTQGVDQTDQDWISNQELLE